MNVQDKKDQPNLGLATTRQLIEELQARWEVAHVGDTNPIPSLVLAAVLELFRRDDSLTYRTVDN